VAEPEAVKASAQRKPSAASARKGDEGEELLIPETEEALNIPKQQTVRMLGLMSALTLVAWFASRLACNAHPDQVREPKHFSTKDLAADPKNAAFEFHHSFETGDYVTALDLATGDVKKLVETKLAECEQNADACEENQKSLAGSVTSTGRVFEQSAERASVELVSHYRKQQQPKTFNFVVVKQGDYYRVMTRTEVPNAVPAAPVTPVATPAAVGASSAAAQPDAPPLSDQVAPVPAATEDSPKAAPPQP
jgi:hypothetical protein